MQFTSCFLFLVLCSSVQCQSKKAGFVDHIVNFVNGLVNQTSAPSTQAPSSPRPRSQVASAVGAPIVVAPGENPANAINRIQNSVLAINLMSTLAPPAVRPCFVRPAFCPATSDACSKSRCARLYANGVRIGSRYYKRVKCRLNYCRETCGKAEWYADGRRLVGCSDSSSTLDSPAWSVARLFPKPNRLDSRVLPVERVASPRTPSQITGGVPFDQVQAQTGVSGSNGLTPRSSGSNQPQRRSINQYIGDIGEAIANKTRELNETIRQKFDELNSKRVQSALIHAANVTSNGIRDLAFNVTSFIDKQLQEAMENGDHGVEHDAEHESVKSNKNSAPQKQSSKTDLWLLLFLVGLFR